MSGKIREGWLSTFKNSTWDKMSTDFFPLFMDFCNKHFIIAYKLNYLMNYFILKSTLNKAKKSHICVCQLMILEYLKSGSWHSQVGKLYIL